MAGNNPLEPDLGSDANTPSFVGASKGFKAASGVTGALADAASDIMTPLVKGLRR